MELTAMRYFAAVARELHFRRAAARLHITEAPLSAAIRKLEEEVGARLFERTSRSVRLTAAGRALEDRAASVPEGLAGALSPCRSLSSDKAPGLYAACDDIIATLKYSRR